MRNVNRFEITVLIAAASVLLVSVTALGIDESGAKNLKLRKIKTPDGMDVLVTIESMVVIDVETTIAFAMGKLKGSDTSALYSFNLSRQGKITSYHSMAEGTSSACCSIWLGTESVVGGASADLNKGLLFYSKKSERAAGIYVIGFNAYGQPTAEEKKIYELSNRKGTHWGNVFLIAEKGPSSVGLTYSSELFINDPSARDHSEAYFAELDFDGNLIGEVKKVPLKKGGKDTDCMVHKPAWNGIYWLVPAELHRYNQGRVDVLVIVAGSNASSSPANNYSTKIRTILKSKDYILNYYEADLQFLTSSSNNAASGAIPSTDGKVLKLFIHRFKKIPFDQKRLTNREYSSLIQPVKYNGKKAGKAINLQIDHWVPNLKLGENKIFFFNIEKHSYCAPLGDGSILLAQACSACSKEEVSAPSSTYKYNYANQVNLLALDPDSGTVELLATKSINFKGYANLAPHLQIYDGKIRLITLYKEYGSPVYTNFFTCYSP